MNVSARSTCLASALLAAGVILAAGAPSSPQYESLLMQVLSANRRGVCPADLMSAALQASCTAQLGDLQLKLNNLGEITGVTYLGPKTVAGESGEAYKASFEHGDWLWTLAAREGKASTAFAPMPAWNVASYSARAADWHSQ